MDLRGTIFISLLLSAALFALDLTLPLGVAWSALYVFVVLLSLWSPHRLLPLFLACLCSGLTILGFFWSPQGGELWKVLTNRFLALTMIWVTATLLFFWKRTEEQRTETLQRLSTVVTSAVDGIVSIDMNGAIETFNPAAERLFGYPADEAIGKNVSMLMPSPYHEEHDGYIERYRTTGEAKIIGIGREVVGRRKDATTFPLELAVSEMWIGNRQNFTAVLRDVTERKAWEVSLSTLNQTLDARAKELARSNSDLEQFAYSASHDLREPLRGITGCLQLLEERYKDRLDAKAHEFISHSVAGAERLEALIDGMLRYSRLGTHGKNLVRANCATIVDRVLANLKTLIKETGTVVRVDALPTIECDSTQLLQLFQNLLGNAIKYHREEPPQIHISAQQVDHEWRFAIQDNGMGIDMKFADRIFVIFQRLHGRAKYSGTGIGLAICKRIVERHGGIIWIESEPGKGSTFYFTIPEKVEGGDVDEY